MFESGTRAIFFDAVGTLLFPRVPVARTYVEFGRRHGVDLPEADVRLAFRHAFARQEEIDFKTAWRTDEKRECARWQAIVSEVLPEADGSFDALWTWFSTPAAWTVNPDAGDVLRQLTGRGVVLGIASNFDSRLFGVIEAFADLAPLRRRAAISSLIGWRKPAAEFFAELVQLAECQAGEILYVGDDLQNDVQGAISAGLKAILYDPDGQSAEVPRIARLRDLLPP